MQRKKYLDYRWKIVRRMGGSLFIYWNKEEKEIYNLEEGKIMDFDIVRVEDER